MDKYLSMDSNTHKDYVELFFDEGMNVIVLHRDEARKLAKDLWYEFREVDWI